MSFQLIYYWIEKCDNCSKLFSIRKYNHKSSLPKFQLIRELETPTCSICEIKLCPECLKNDLFCPSDFERIISEGNLKKAVKSGKQKESERIRDYPIINLIYNIDELKEESSKLHHKMRDVYDTAKKLKKKAKKNKENFDSKRFIDSHDVIKEISKHFEAVPTIDNNLDMFSGQRNFDLEYIVAKIYSEPHHASTSEMISKMNIDTNSKSNAQIIENIILNSNLILEGEFLLGNTLTEKKIRKAVKKFRANLSTDEKPLLTHLNLISPICFLTNKSLYLIRYQKSETIRKKIGLEELNKVEFELKENGTKGGYLSDKFTLLNFVDVLNLFIGLRKSV